MTDAENNLGPLTPQTEPRKTTKKVLAGLLAAAGIAGATAAYMVNENRVQPRLAADLYQPSQVKKAIRPAPPELPIKSADMDFAGNVSTVKLQTVPSATPSNSSNK